MMHRLRSISLLAVSAVLATAGVAYADATPTVTGTVNPGTLSVATSATPSFTSTLDGTDQTKNYTVPLEVTDATGSGDGWNLTITSTLFDDGAGHTLASDASTVKSSVTVGCHTGSTCVAPTDTTAVRPLTLPAAASAPAGTVFYNADVATGTGKIDVTPSVDVAVPASTHTGTYTSDLTIAAVSGP
jgi:hypothetical protein